MRATLLIAASGIVLCSTNRDAQCGLIVGYTLSSSASPTTVDANVTATNFTGGSGLGDVTFSGSATADKWNSNSASAALSHAEEWTFTVTPKLGEKLSLTSISFDEWHSSPDRNHFGPTDFQVLVNGTQVSAADVSSTATSSPGTLQTFDFNLSGLTAPVSVQIIAWNAHDASDNSTWSVTNVNLDGTASPVSTVPEPASLGIFAGLGIAGSCFARRRRRDGR